MREIKFRGKHKDILGQECEWIYGSYLNPRDSCSAHFIADREIPGLTEVIPITVCQFTGLKDKNGTEIYEGDVVDVVPILGIHFRGVVKFNSHISAFEVFREERGDSTCLKDDFSIEILGNVFDNPELEKYEEVYFRED